MSSPAWTSDTPIVIRRITNYYSVRFQGEEFLCLPRARLKKEHVSILVGDRVELEGVDLLNHKATISDVLPRFNQLPRPPIANVNQAVIVFSADRPPFNPMLLDRFLVLVALSGIEAAIAINKADLVAPAILEQLCAPYRAIGYQVVTASAQGHDVSALRSLLIGKETVFAGPSGVGKSSLLNALHPGLALKAAEVSEKSSRGRHTTTFASLYPLDFPEGLAFVADTPGYSHLEFGAIAPTELGWYYPEMVEHLPDCRFPDCLHRGEPGCAVKERASLHDTRHASYLRFLEELEVNQARLSAMSSKSESRVKHQALAGGGETRLIKLGFAERDGSRRTAKQKLQDVDLVEEEDLPELDDLAD